MTGGKQLLAKHIYVVDTCVLIHDPNALYKFKENDIYLPLAVIDDLDEIKTRRDPAGWAAREVFRNLDQYDLSAMVNKGVVVNSQGGRLFVYNLEAPTAKGEAPAIVRVNSDNAIIQTALVLKSKFPRRKVAVVTKDTGLRVRAQSMGCEAENYRSDLLEDAPYDGVRYVELDAPDWSLMYGGKVDSVDPAKLSKAAQARLADVAPNEFVVFKSGNACCPTWNRGGTLVMLRDKGGKPEFMGIKPYNLEQRFAMEAVADPSIPLVILTGAAGTGKTLTSVAVALQRVIDGEYDRVVVIKPNVPVGGVDIGALPGDKYEKLSAWLGPIRDNVQQLLGDKKRGASLSFEQMVDDGMIEVEALSFIQGRSITNSVVIVDELQNVSPRVARMIVERCGKDSKVILLGDPSQVENAFLDHKSNGLSHAANGARSSELAAVVALKKVERSPLAAAASEIFASPEARR